MADFPLLLNTSQELFLWEKIIASTHAQDYLLQISKTAELVQSAWKLLQQWQLDVEQPLFASTEDYLALRQWVRQFQQLCDKNNWLTSAALPRVLAEAAMPPSPPLILIGFTELSPQIQTLLTGYQQAGTPIYHYDIAYDAAEKRLPARISLATLDDEITNMACWAKNLHQQYPEKSIGCVIPSLDKMRDRVMQIFTDVFASDRATPTLLDQTSLPFNITAGKILSTYPIIHIALQLLNLPYHAISLEVFSHLLTSPFLGGAEKERIARAKFDRWLRQKNIQQIELSQITAQTTHCPLLVKLFAQISEHLPPTDAQHSFNAWTAIFNQLLILFGWPGERSINSDEFQIIDNWFNLLATYATLDQIAEPVTYAVALATLQKMANKAVFQPKTPVASIQVLGVLEAAAMPFDYLWVAGLDDLAWPPPPQPNPFIPKRLQRELRMPHATAERELIYCEQLMQQFQDSSGSLIVSHALHQEELELQASPLIREFVEVGKSPSPPTPPINQQQTSPLSPACGRGLGERAYQSAAEKIFATRLIETLIDDTAPTLKPDEKIRGGVNVIKQQALCPFKAFAEWRLHAQPLATLTPGLRPQDRGTLLHKTLEHLWQQLQDHSSLCALSETALDQQLQLAIQQAVDKLAMPQYANTAYFALELQRLQQVIKSWLRLEKERPPFKVLAAEKTVDMQLNQLTLQFRIDRIDLLENGQTLIIDYKTSKQIDVKQWFSDRPEEPQLPLYALLANDTHITCGITFAQLTPGHYQFKGLSQYTLDIPGIKSLAELKQATTELWSEQLTLWQTTFNQLSDDFYHGRAPVNPKHAQVCEWCELQPLCRITNL
jgi:probable DNA repair protein